MQPACGYTWSCVGGAPVTFSPDWPIRHMHRPKGTTRIPDSAASKARFTRPGYHPTCPWNHLGSSAGGALPQDLHMYLEAAEDWMSGIVSLRRRIDVRQSREQRMVLHRRMPCHPEREWCYDILMSC